MRGPTDRKKDGIQCGKPVQGSASATNGRGTARSVEDWSPTACRCTEHVKAQDECTKIKMGRCALRGMKCAFPSDRKYFSEMGMAASSRREEEHM